MKDARFSSKAYGTHDFKEISIEGRVQFDLYQAIQRDHKLSSYSLNSVSAHFLGEQKEDVHHSDISKLQDGNAETRRRLAIYCLKVGERVGGMRIDSVGRRQLEEQQMHGTRPLASLCCPYSPKQRPAPLCPLCPARVAGCRTRTCPSAW